MIHGIFIPHEKLDELASSGRADMTGDELTLLPEGCRYRVAEAARVLREVASGTDSYGLCGTVRTRAYLCDELGGELLGDSILIDEAAYDVVPGILCEASGEIDGDVLPGGELELLQSL
jgi:hypothetical protein